jgi:hypothetical protein
MKGRLERQLCAALDARLSGKPARVPEAGFIIWNTFQQLCARRTGYDGGMNPLQPSEVEAYCRLMRLPFEPHHVSILFALDDVWLTCLRDQQRLGADGVKRMHHHQSGALTPALFDVFMG